MLNDAVKKGMIVKHTPGATGVAGAVAADAGQAVAGSPITTELLTKFGTYGVVFALGMVVAAAALGKTLDINVVDRDAQTPAPPATPATPGNATITKQYVTLSPHMKTQLIVHSNNSKRELW